jgi:hypothetical protein
LVKGGCINHDGNDDVVAVERLFRAVVVGVAVVVPVVFDDDDVVVDGDKGGNNTLRTLFTVLLLRL